MAMLEKISSFVILYLLLTNDLILSNSVIDPRNTMRGEGGETDLTKVCGLANQRNPASNSKVIGGAETEPFEFPWQVFLVIDFYEWGLLACGGTLISDRWVLTAAHCLDGLYHQKANNIAIHLGVHNISSAVTNNNEPHRKLYYSRIYHIHPGWHEENNEPQGDIALIRLPVAINISDYIRPICLPLWNETDHEGDDVIVIGWGKTSPNSGMSDVLRKSKTNVVTKSDCVRVYGSLITDDIICSESDRYHGICNGDSGGSMNYFERDGTWTQIGVASFVSDFNCTSGDPDGFTRVRSYLDWIYPIIGEINPDPRATTTTIADAKPITMPNQAVRLINTNILILLYWIIHFYNPNSGNI